MRAETKLKPELKKTSPYSRLVRPGELGLILELTVKDKDGRVTDRRTMRGKSFLRQFLELLFIQMSGTYTYGSSYPYHQPVMYVKDINGYLRPVAASIYYHGDIFDADAGVGSTGYGIVAGAGTTPPNIDDYNLESMIGHGSGAGQMGYGAMTFGLPTSDPTTSHFTLTRDFSNSSGVTITVNEVGVRVKANALKYNQNWDTAYFLIIRDVISGGINVPNGQTLTVNYREQAAI